MYDITPAKNMRALAVVGFGPSFAQIFLDGLPHFVRWRVVLESGES